MAEPELRQAWERHAPEWIAWARTPGHDSYWKFHRESFLPLVPGPGRLTVDLGCGEGRVAGISPREATWSSSWTPPPR